MINMVWLDSKTTVPHAVLRAVERQRLVDLLRESGPRRLTIVRAPAGYGKTTLLSQWISQFGEPAVWLSIDDGDNDPIRFWKYVIRAVADVVTEEINIKLLSLFNEQSPLELIIDSFLNEIDSFERRIHIVIDDYHLIGNPVIHDMMARFIGYLPSNICIYLASRAELSLPLAKWRVKEWITEIGVDQLRFTYKEMERFYEKRNFTSENNESLQQVYKMTEGWAAGIQLAGLSGRITDDTFDSKHSFVTEFLLQEILETLSLTTQDFLLRTSILNQLEPAICNALTKRTDSHHILMELEKNGHFIVRLHASKSIFRYHHLFADALQIELRQRYSQDSVSSFYKEAANVLREQGDFSSAIDLVLRGQLYEEADSWITAHLVEIFTLGQTSTFIRWVRVLRDSGYSVNIETLVMYITTLSTIYEMREASQLIIELDRRHEVDQWMDDIDYRGMASILETVRAFVLLAGGKDIEQSMGIIGKQVSRGHVSSRWDNIPMQYNWFDPTLIRTSIGSRGRLLWQEEVLPLLQLFQQADFKENNLSGFAFGITAETSYARNSLDQALVELEAALQYGHHFNDASLFIPMYLLKGRIYAAKKQFVEAHVVLDYAMETTKGRHWIDSVRTMKALCYLIEGNMSQAEHELSASTGLNTPNAESVQEFWLLVHTRLLLAKGQKEDALKTSLFVKEKALREGQISTIIEAMILEAVCQMDLGKEEVALAVLHQALEQGAPYGYVRTFLDEVYIAPLLKKYLKIRQMSDRVQWVSVPISYVEQLVAEVQNDTSVNQLVEKLTPREQNVLQLLTIGASNGEIAKQLNLSEGTVRVYLSRIYSKLGVDSRTKAVLLTKDD